ncbi:MAG: endonuclease III domain-containing protein [Candidatus Anammoxibacter sp.]
MTNSAILKKIYDRLYSTYGPCNWWPGDSPFEVIIGAILTQNTNWTNVEKAIRNLKDANVFTPDKFFKIEITKLAELIKPAGYFNVKAKRIKKFINWLFENYDGDLTQMFAQSLGTLREELLSVNGIGPETADSILLYAGNKPTFVVDTYTYRILSRHDLIPEDSTYDDIKDFLEDNMPEDVKLYNEYHALLVQIGKEFCKPKRKCENCPLNGLLEGLVS